MRENLVHKSFTIIRNILKKTQIHITYVILRSDLPLIFILKMPTNNKLLYALGSGKIFVTVNVYRHFDEEGND